MIETLVCPKCKSNINLAEKSVQCTSIECNVHYPIVEKIPILINESNSLFSIADIVSASSASSAPSKRNILRRSGKFLSDLLPEPNGNLKGKENLKNFITHISSNHSKNDNEEKKKSAGSWSGRRG